MQNTNIITSDPLKLIDILDKYGVAILENYFSDNYADNLFTQAKQWLIDLNIGLTANIADWRTENMPLGPKYGMYQSIITHFPGFWKLREDMYPLFAYLVGQPKLYTSLDGASLYPNNRKFRANNDWAHIDQTTSSDCLCYQAQYVTTNTTASFVATIASHLKHAQILDLCGVKYNSSNWLKFDAAQIDILSQMFCDNYQTPIYAKKNSIIFWDSRTIHSAKYPDSDDNSWRGVFYVSMRATNDYTPRNLNTLTKAAIEGRTTNHWGTRMFPTSSRFCKLNDKTTNLLANLSSISYVANMTPCQKRLVGLQPW